MFVIPQTKFHFYNNAHFVKGQHGTPADVLRFLDMAERFGVFDRRMA